MSTSSKIAAVPGKKGKTHVTEINRDKSDVEEFTVPSQDLKGHSARVGFRVEPLMMRLVAELVQGGGAALGWKTDSDFWRWAGMAGLEYASAKIKDGKISNMGKQVRFMMEIVATRARMMEFEANFTELERTVTALSASDNEDEAVLMLIELKAQIADMDDDKWRKRWSKKFDKKFGTMLRA